jgi:hypothetical protein
MQNQYEKQKISEKGDSKQGVSDKTSENQKQSSTEVKIESKLPPIGEKKLSLPRTTTMKIPEKSQNANYSSIKDSSNNKLISKFSSGGINDTIDILRDDNKKREHSFDSNKSGGKNSRGHSRNKSGNVGNSKERRNSKPPIAKKKVNFNFVSKNSAGELKVSEDSIEPDATKLARGEANSAFERSKTINVENSKLVTEKKTLKSEISKKSESNAFHQRTNTMFTLQLDGKENSKKGEEGKNPGLSSITGMLV